MIHTYRWDESRFDDCAGVPSSMDAAGGPPSWRACAGRRLANAAMPLRPAATINSRIMKSPNSLLLKALGDPTATGKSNYVTNPRGTAISGLKSGYFTGLGADFRVEKSNCADAAGRATAGFLASSRAGKVELSSRPPAATARRTHGAVGCRALGPTQAIKTPSRLADRPLGQHSMGTAGTETAPAFRHRATGVQE